jgi:hypothetical protein
MENFDEIYHKSYNKQPEYLVSPLDDNVCPLLYSESLFEQIFKNSHNELNNMKHNEN